MKTIRSGLYGAVLALLCLTLVTVPTTGCAPQATIAALTQTLGSAAASVAAIEGNAALATQLTNDTNAAVAAIQNWKSGTPDQEVIEALNLVQSDLALFPQTDQYAPLINLAIGTAESIIALLPNSGALQASYRHVTLLQPAPKNAKEFTKQWNEIVSTHPGFEPAKL